MPKEARERIAANTPLRRFGQPEDIANAVVFFCSDYSRFVTGSYLPVSGGIQMPWLLVEALLPSWPPPFTFRQTRPGCRRTWVWA
jgi:hypothetical protein